MQLLQVMCSVQSTVLEFCLDYRGTPVSGITSMNSSEPEEGFWREGGRTPNPFRKPLFAVNAAV